MHDGFDPRFQRPRLTEDSVRESLAQLAERTANFHADRAEWMIADIIEGDWSNMGSGPTITAWKNHDRLLTAEEKRALGINPRVKVCERIVDTLTAKGLEDVNETLVSIFTAPIFARGHARSLSRAGETGWKLRLSVVQDARTCRIAKAEHGRLFDPALAPDLPLPGCDAASCRCSLLALPPSTEARLKAEGRAWEEEDFSVDRPLTAEDLAALQVPVHEAASTKEVSETRKLAAFLIVAIVIVLLLSAALGR